MAKLTLKDLPKLLQHELIVIKSTGLIPILEIVGPTVRPILLDKTTIRSLIVAGHELHQYKTVSSLKVNVATTVDTEPAKTVPVPIVESVKLPDEKPVVFEPEILVGHRDPQGELGEPGANTSKTVIEPVKEEKVKQTEEETTVKIIYTFDDLKSKNNNDLKKILKERNIDLNTGDRNMMINKIIQTNPEA